MVSATKVRRGRHDDVPEKIREEMRFEVLIVTYF